MKKLLTIIAFFVFSISFAQIEYPMLKFDESGREVVVMTVEQAQKLDNDTDLLKLYKTLDDECAKRDQICIQVINDKDKIIASQKIEISNLSNYTGNKESQIATLQKTINEYIVNNSILKTEVENRQKLVDENKNLVVKLKSKIKWGGIGSGIITIGLGILLLIK
jgi:hypothetical protein